MAILLWFLLALYLLIVAAWGWGAKWIRRLYNDAGMWLDPLPEAQPDPGSPSLAVYLAAHNEEDRIGPCLDRLLAQNYGRLLITVVCDRSADATAEQARAVAARDSRVQVLQVEDLPAGWIGKTHALATATAGATADYLLFIDCDCRLAPGALAAVMGKVVTEGLEFVSLWPHLDLHSFAERLLIPPASWLLGPWALAGAERGAASWEVSQGNGQFMLFSRAAYQQVGGHGAVQAELAEDARLAEKAAKLGLKRWAGLGKRVYFTTRDGNLGRVINAVIRVAAGSLVQPGRILASTQIVLAGILMPVWLLPLMLCLAVADGAIAYWVFAGATIIHLGLMWYVLGRQFAMTLVRPPPPVLFLVGSALLVWVLIRTYLVMTGRGTVRWGGVAYKVRNSRIVQGTPA